MDGVLLRHDALDGAGTGAREDPAYEDIASKFFEHFVAIADAMNTLGGTGYGTSKMVSTMTCCTRAARRCPCGCDRSSASSRLFALRSARTGCG